MSGLQDRRLRILHGLGRLRRLWGSVLRRPGAGRRRPPRDPPVRQRRGRVARARPDLHGEARHVRHGELARARRWPGVLAGVPPLQRLLAPIRDRRGALVRRQALGQRPAAGAAAGLRRLSGGLRVESAARLSGAEVVLQRRAGARWRTVVRRPFRLERTELVASLPAGRQRLRALVVVGATQFRSRSGRSQCAGRAGAPPPGATTAATGRARASRARSRCPAAASGCAPSRRRSACSASGRRPPTTGPRSPLRRSTSARIAPDGSITGYVRTAGGAPSRSPAGCNGRFRARWRSRSRRVPGSGRSTPCAARSPPSGGFEERPAQRRRSLCAS